MIKTTNFAWTLIAMVTLLGITMLATLSYGSVEFSFTSTWHCLVSECQSTTQDLILWELRWPRILLAFVAGAGLAVAGAMLQNATANPLAEPYLFGLISGASLGAILFNLLDFQLGQFGLPIAAFGGCLLALAIVVLVFQSLPGKKSEHLILIGVSVSFMLAAISQFLLYISEPLAANRIVFWLMGSVANNGMEPILMITPVLLIVTLAVVLFRRHIDALLLGDETAKSLGVHASRIRIGLLIGAAGLTAVIVAFCGGIGFVGLMIPHIVRQFGFVKTGLLVPACALLGGIFLMWVDLISRATIDSQEIPIGVVTAALGSLFFLILLKSKGR